MASLLALAPWAVLLFSSCSCIDQGTKANTATLAKTGILWTTLYHCKYSFTPQICTKLVHFNNENIFIHFNILG
jgi:hypothetical protein